jgi:hypothetical protein
MLIRIMKQMDEIPKGAVGYCGKCYNGVYRIMLPRQYILDLPPGALAVYDIDASYKSYFKKIKESDLTKKEKSFLKQLDSETK